MKIERGDKSMRIAQELQIVKTLKQFDMENCKAKDTPSETLRLTQSDCPSTQRRDDRNEATVL